VVSLDRTSGVFVTEQRLWVSADWDRVPAGSNLLATFEVNSSAGSKQLTVPIFKPARPARGEISGFVESHGCVSMEAEHFTRKQDRGGAAWKVIPGLGRSGDSVAVYPPTVSSRTNRPISGPPVPRWNTICTCFTRAMRAWTSIVCLPIQSGRAAESVWQSASTGNRR